MILIKARGRVLEESRKLKNESEFTEGNIVRSSYFHAVTICAVHFYRSITNTV